MGAGNPCRQHRNVASENRDRLIAVIGTWYVQAGKYNVMPVDGSGLPRMVVIDRAVYGTIVITSTRVIYDGWANLRVLGAVAVILGPVVAMVIGHMFAASLAAYAELRRRSTKRELLRTASHESRFLLVCVPQIVLLLALKLAGASLNVRSGGDLD